MLLFTAHTRDTVQIFFSSYSLFTIFFAWHSEDFVFVIYKSFFASFKMIMLCPVFAEIHLKNQKHILILITKCLLENNDFSKFPEDPKEFEIAPPRF